MPEPFKLKVLTPKVQSSDNQFLNLFWNSVVDYGIEVEPIQEHKSVFQLVLEPKKGDVVHLHWIHKFCKLEAGKELKSWRKIFSNLLKLGLLKLQGYQIVWTVHNTISHACRTPAIEKQFRRLLSHLCDDIIVMSEYSRQEFIRLYDREHRVHIVPHGNYISAYPNQLSRAEARRTLQIASHQTVMLHLGRIMRYKGIDKLLAGFEKLKDPNTLLLIAGSCKDLDLQKEILQASQKDSRILPKLEFIPDEDIQLYMNACDWVVLPYRKILNSGSALLALSFGKPIIGPKQGAIAELIQDGQQGLIYSDDEDLVIVLQKALTISRDHWQTMCMNAYKLAEKYSWTEIGSKLHHIYQHGTSKKYSIPLRLANSYQQAFQKLQKQQNN